MKEPDKIKHGLMCLIGCCCGQECETCFSNVYTKKEQLLKQPIHDAYAYIQQLESTIGQVSKALCGKENATLDEVLQAVRQVKADASRKDDTIRNLTELLNAANDEAAKYRRERDELLSDLKNYGCYTCEHYECEDNEMPCRNCEAFSLWERMGVCPENTEVQDDG